MDKHLTPLIPNIPSHIKDTNHLIELMKPLQLPIEAKLVTLDVSSLFTNIPHTEGVQAINQFLLEHSDPQKANMITELSNMVLKNNVFEFNGDFYEQISGTAMGTRMAPAYANIFMHYFETKHLPNAPVKPILWKRYIDDIIALFTCTYDEIKDFENWINNLHPTIKFTLNIDPKGVSFLDTFLNIENNQIRIRPFTKPTDTKQYINPNSCHPPHTIKSIPYSQALRIKRICTTNEDLVREMNNLFGYFTNRKYPSELLVKFFNKALHSHHTHKKDTTSTTMVITYNPRNPTYASTMNQIWKLHVKNLPGNLQRPIVCYKRPRNLRDQLV